MRSKKIKVLYILGMTRSGTTVMDRILGNIDGFVSLGEFYTLWQQYVINNRLCGCGKYFRECELWQSVFNTACGGFDNCTVKSFVDSQARYFRTRHVPNLFLPAYTDWMQRHLSDYLQVTEKLYQAIYENAAARLIIDSSKLPTYASAISQMESIEFYYIHVIRDPRGVAYSWQKIKRGIDGSEMNKLHPIVSASLWNITNLACERFLRATRRPYLRINYEAFIQNPKAVIQSIIDLTGEKVGALPFKSESSVELAATHNLEGNPDRFDSGITFLREDKAWLSKLPLHYKYLVSLITLPLLHRYNYSLNELHGGDLRWHAK